MRIFDDHYSKNKKQAELQLTVTVLLASFLITVFIILIQKDVQAPYYYIGGLYLEKGSSNGSLLFTKLDGHGCALHYVLQQCLYFFPLPQGQGLLRPTFSAFGCVASSMAAIMISSMLGSAGIFIAEISWEV